MSDDRLLREYVRRVVTEAGEDDSVVGAVKNVFKTAAAGTKKIARKAGTIVSIALQSVATIIPFIKADYGSTFAKEREAISKINEEYSDVYDATRRTLNTGDAAFLALAASPSLFVGAVAAAAGTKSVEAAAEALSALSGGGSDKIEDVLKKAAAGFDRWATGHNGHDQEGSFSAPRGHKKSPKEAESVFDKLGESKQRLHEASASDFISKIATSPRAQTLAKSARAVYRTTLKDLHGQAVDAVKTAATVEGVKKLSKGKSSVPSSFKDESDRQTYLDAVKDAIKAEFIRVLEARVNEAVSAGVPEIAAYVKDHRTVIEKIKTL